jgi:hypothetical protein
MIRRKVFNSIHLPTLIEKAYKIMKLTNLQNKLMGKWIYQNDTIQKDIITQQIEWLISNHLKKIAIDKMGWEVLYIDPDDNRFWELTYPQSEMQGGGPPALINISKEEAEAKYSLIDRFNS